MLGVTARNVTGLVDALQRDGLVERLPTLAIGGPPWLGSPRRGSAWRASCWRAAGRLAELLAELPEADQRNLLHALESLRAVPARHPEL
jgi:hypothetical protein